MDLHGDRYWGIEVERLDPCNSLTADTCISVGDPFLPTELGINKATTISMTIRLDGSVGIGFIGFECGPVDAYGNGADLAALFSAFDGAYMSVIAAQLAAGLDPSAVAAVIVASPTGGFSGAALTCPANGDSGLVFRSGDAPPILMQTITASTYDQATGTSTNAPLTPVTATRLNTVEVVGGKMTLLFYAGFFS